MTKSIRWEELLAALQGALEHIDDNPRQQTADHQETAEPEITSQLRPVETTCSCGGELHEIDRSGPSATACCEACQEFFLLLAVNDPPKRVPIQLRQFDQRRGDGPGRRPLDDLGMAKRLKQDLFLDLWPSLATTTDFGIRDTEHYAALKEAVFRGVTAYELDRVLGDGQAITQLVRATAGDSYPHVEFETSYDLFYELDAQVEQERGDLDPEIER